MINLLDNLLREILLRNVDGLTRERESQIGFQPPDEQWRNQVSAEANLLNIYLVDLRENRKLRSNERVQTIENGFISETPVPARVDCHYLITAWSPAQPPMEGSIDEHGLLYQTASVLLRSDPLNPSQVYPPGSLPLSNWPEDFQTVDLPLSILPPEGFPKLSEFWQTMGEGARWKPVIYLIVTLPVALLQVSASPMVTTRITEYRRVNQLGEADVWIQIGGHVLDATVDPPVPLVNAWVQLENTDGDPLQTTLTDALGRFTFERLQPGDNYQLRWRAGARPEPAPRPITIPSPTGEYDLQFV